MTINFDKDKSGFLRVSPLPSQEELAAYYSSDYYQNPHGTYCDSYSQEEISHKKIRCGFLFSVATETLSESGTFLDVGCGEGFLLDAFSSRGWDVLGLDFSGFGISRFNPHLRNSCIEGDVYDSLEHLRMGGRKFDCINLGNVLEHVLDPLALLRSIDALLPSLGILVITVPNDFSSLQLFLEELGDISSRYWVTVPDHLNYFTNESLRSIVTEAGLLPLEAYADFPIEWFLANESSNYRKNSDVGKFAHSARVKLDSFITNQSDFTSVKNFWSALAGIGQGRTISLLCQKPGIR